MIIIFFYICGVWWRYFCSRARSINSSYQEFTTKINTTMTQTRLSPVRSRRDGTPFVNFPSFTSHAHPDQQIRMWRGEGEDGWGIRHIADNAPFSLWQEQDHEFRFPTDDEKKWIRGAYGATARIGLFGNIMVLETNTIPPSPLPLTVAGMPTSFVPVLLPPGEFLRDPFPPRRWNTTDYASPHVKDPVSGFKLAHWKDPTQDQTKQISYALNLLASVKTITYVWKFTIVEICVDGRKYERRSLPGIVAGCTVLYHHNSQPYWGAMTEHKRSNTPNPAMDIQDITNYLTVGSRDLRPGVRLSSSKFDINSKPQTSISTTAGVILRNGPQVRLTCALQGWLNSNDVYHPDASSGGLIGTIRERYDAQDVALVDLNPSIQYTNKTYFDATPPRRLLARTDTENNSRGHWYRISQMACPPDAWPMHDANRHA